ncbi:glycolipid 2-alpha-mannosyltransferase [Boeremia exigua]|uniref:glycolipid 2-alpha-mannosyltransferase n=1 Tax=Boeremia exigua TaxID=749465 RepID=UPI001E8E32E2|nr:glycolipid 2-alpha-mannosyltransferase [Boeremia exigua]KAH6618632.1 glycolipid 2-alpha-mannosyltransferase [Boeremia exigua]
MLSLRLRPTRPANPICRLYHFALRHWKVLSLLAFLVLLELVFHVRSFRIDRPTTDLDPPFHVGCQEPILGTAARANATLMMLARNSDVDGAVASVKSVQTQFNKHFGYPWVFLNNEPWSDDFVTKVREAGAGVSMTFETIPARMWGYPAWIDREAAREKMDQMQNAGIMYAGTESYHHMCRFQSGFFYDHPALKPYKWYWRVEPDISFTCSITYDPFVEMAKHGKTYGYTIALWENGRTAASLFRKLSTYKADMHFPTTSLWKAMMAASYMPWPFRYLLSFLRNRDANGDLWNMCHFWSNFEIADMDFFRSQQYRDMFRFLDEEGGFYYERWGDAPVHSLAAAMLLRPEQVHHFSDFGYRHADFQYCTEELGCKCTCDPAIKIIDGSCFNSIKSTVM